MAGNVPSVPVGGAGAYTMVIQLGGKHTATTADIARPVLNGRHVLLGVSAIARAGTGGATSCKLDIKQGGQSLLAAPLAVTATAATYATMLDLSASGGAGRPVIADEGMLSLGLTLAGASVEYSDLTVSLHLARA